MKTILKFCHDYQNRTGCTRPDCTYLHSTREDQNLFLTTGQIPEALVERHAKMSSPVHMNMNEYIAQGPPPPPPPPPSTTASQPPLPATLSTLSAPPPPPLPPSPTTSNTSVQMTESIISAPSPISTSTVFPLGQPPPPLPLMFDASRPPPPIQSNSISHKSGSLKRAVAELFDASPCKARKVEGSKVVDSLCQNCVQRELRMELYRQEMQKLECEKEYHTYIYKKKSEEYENTRLLLKSVTSPELFCILDEYIAGSSQPVEVNDVMAQFNQTSSFVSETSTVPRQFLLQLMDCVFSKPRNLVDPTPVPSIGVDEPSILHSLTAFARRTNPISHKSTDVLQAVVEVIRKSTSLNSGSNRPSTSNMNSNAVNGFSHLMNGHKVVSVTSTADAGSSRSSITNVPVRTYPSGAANAAVAPPTAPHPPTTSHFSNALHPASAPLTRSAPYPPVVTRPPLVARPSVALRPPVAIHPPAVAQPTTVAHPPGATYSPNVPYTTTVRAVVVAQPAYLPYEPAVLPRTNRPYYPQTYTTTINHVKNINTTYPNTPVRAGVTPQLSVQPSTSVTAPPAQNIQNCNPYVMGRYPPQSHYYPRFQ